MSIDLEFCRRIAEEQKEVPRTMTGEWMERLCDEVERLREELQTCEEALKDKKD